MEERVVSVQETFGEDVFNDAVMRQRLPKKVYEALRRNIEDGTELSPETADTVAHEMKAWAIEKGATHFTHWFQPLTGVTAEKHDSFITAPLPSGKVLMSLSGKELIKGEPDASSFPSGGLRATFEARGYTIWDSASPAFVRHDEGGATLCIPTAFCSYTGEALDQKTPLLRSMEAVNREALRLIRLFGNTTSRRVTPYVGPEQEYFIIDRDKYLQRMDLVFTGRTLFGAKAPKGQELDDHYFGTLKSRIASYMQEVNQELWRLGVPAKTQHNEAAPAQHELAPIYEKVNVAVDHNQIIMQTLKRVATRHGLRCLLHEKPFDGVNGSGKHDNWSLMTDDGINLLEPGKTPHENIQFLLVMTCILRAVDRHADLLRESASDVGNDLRLGGNEAPPAIISVFLGEQLEDVIDQLASTGHAARAKDSGKLETGVSYLNNISKDATDRNRTSPFAFTGNKFEFRMVGSRDSVAGPNVVLNTIVAEAFRDACDRLEEAGEEGFDLAVHDLIKDYAAQHQRIIFNGNGYSESWVTEAKRRGLPNITSFVDAVPSLTTEKSVALFERFGVFSEKELISRSEVKYETYSKDILIEARTMLEMAGKQLLPAMMRCAGRIAESAGAVAALGVSADVQMKRLRTLTGLLEEAQKACETLEDVTKETEKLLPGRSQAVACRDRVIPAMAALRSPVDRAEMITDKDLWPIPSYADLLFEI